MFVYVVGPGFDSKSSTFVRSRANQAAVSNDPESGLHSWGQGLCIHNLCRCLHHSNLVQDVSFSNYWMYSTIVLLLLLFAMIRSVVKSFKVPDVEVAAARMSNESALTRMTDSTPKKPWSDLTLVLDG